MSFTKRFFLCTLSLSPSGVQRPHTCKERGRMLARRGTPTGGRDMTDPDKERTSILPSALHRLHQEPVGDGCSRSFGDKEMCLLGTVLRAVLLRPKGERTCRSKCLHRGPPASACTSYETSCNSVPRAPQFSQCFFCSFLGILSPLWVTQTIAALTGFVFISFWQGLATFMASFGLLLPRETENETVPVFTVPNKKPFNMLKTLFQGNPKHL